MCREIFEIGLVHFSPSAAPQQGQGTSHTASHTSGRRPPKSSQLVKAAALPIRETPLAVFVPFEDERTPFWPIRVRRPLMFPRVAGLKLASTAAQGLCLALLNHPTLPSPQRCQYEP